MSRTLLPVVVALLLAGTALWLAMRPPPVAVPDRSEIVLSGVTVVNPGMGRRPESRVEIRGDRIVAVGDAASRPANPPAGGPLRWAGTYVLPGLIDMHVHFPPPLAVGQVELFSLLFLAHGVTSVRETGSLGGSAFGIREAIRSGELPGPRIFACGPFLDGDPPVWPLARVVSDAESARRAVAELADDGFDCVKVYSNLSLPVLAAVRESAEEHDLPVVGHLPRASTWTETRIQEIQHVCDPRCFELDASGVEDLVRTAARAGIAHTPTLVVYAQQKSEDEYAAQRRSPEARLLPRFWRDVVWRPDLGLGWPDVPPPQRAAYEREHARVVRTIRHAVRRLFEEGVRIYAGTDPLNPFVVPGASLHQELRLLTEVGLDPEAAWRSATRWPGEALGEPLLGRVVEGAPADLLIFGADPTRDLDALSTLQAVVAAGRLYTRAELDRALARQREHFEGPLYDTLSTAIARLAVGALAP